MREIEILAFQASCLAVLEKVGRTGKPVRIVRSGKPVAEIRPSLAAAPRKWLGAMEGSAELTADITGPLGAFEGWAPPPLR